MKKNIVALALLAAISIAPMAHAVEITISPLATVIDVIVLVGDTAIATTLAPTALTVGAAANREMVMNAVQNDAAANLNGEAASPLLQNVEQMLRTELKNRGDNKAYSDRELAVMIMQEKA